MAKVGLMRSSKGPYPIDQGAGPAYHIPSVFDPNNRLFSAPTRAGHVQTRDWIDYRFEVEAGRNPGPGTYSQKVPDRTGKWDAPIERLTSGMPNSKACQGSYAYTMGLPRKMMPHMDPMSDARRTPSVQTYESFVADKTGKSLTFLETRLSTVQTSPTHKIALKTKYTGGDLMFTRPPDNGVPGVGAYDQEPLTGNAKPLTASRVPAHSIGNDTHGRGSADVSHVSVTGLGMIGVNTDLPQRPQTIQARMHTSCARVDGKTYLKSTLDAEGRPRSRSPSTRPADSSMRHSMSGGAEIFTFPVTPRLATSRLRPRPPASPPTRQLSTLMHMDPDTPGMQTYDIRHTIGYDKNALVRNAPRHTLPIDTLSRSKETIYSTVDADFAVAVITPRHSRTARARLHPTQPEAYTARGLQGRHHAPKTSKSFLASRKNGTDGLLEVYKAKTTGGRERPRSSRQGGLRVPPKTAR